MISQNQTEYLRQFLKTENFTDPDLMDDLIDHLSCEIERQLVKSNITFEEAFESAKKKVFTKEPISVQQDLEFLTRKTQNIMIRKIAYIAGYLSTALLVAGVALIGFSFLKTESAKTAANQMRMEISMAMSGQTASMNQQEVQQEYEMMEKMANSQYLKSSRNSLFMFETGESLLIVSLLLFILAWLPYRFHTKYLNDHHDLIKA